MSKSYRNLLGDIVVIERLVVGKVGISYHARHEKTGQLLPFLRRHLELVHEPVPALEPNLKDLADFFFPKKPINCPLCGHGGHASFNFFECSNDSCRNYVR